jgi:hypothetical protein
MVLNVIATSKMRFFQQRENSRKLGTQAIPSDLAMMPMKVNQ